MSDDGYPVDGRVYSLTTKLKRTLNGHRMWLLGQTGGRRADLRDANLRRANLRGAVLEDAVLRGAVLEDANLRGADLRDADLEDANLRGADLRGAVLRGAVLEDANLEDAELPAYGIPEEGEIVGWKKVAAGVAKVRIPPEAKRTGTLIGRKCRAEFVETLWIERDEHESPGLRDNSVLYRVGERTYPDSYDDDIRVECSHGIHFFLTRREAEEW